MIDLAKQVDVAINEVKRLESVDQEALDGTWTIVVKALENISKSLTGHRYQ